MKKSILPVFPILALAILLTHPVLSFEGAKNGLLLWFNVVLPTLLPFMLCSSLIVSWGGVPVLIRPFKPVFKLLGLSETGSYTLMAGLLCGYPMGAKTDADFLRKGELSLREGKRLLAMSGCPSPMFLAGYVSASLPAEIPFAAVALALYLPIPLIALMSAVIYKTDKSKSGSSADSAAGSAVSDASDSGFDAIMMDALEIMVKIGGYIMLFSILALFINEMLPQSFFFKPLLIGLIEMTTGIQEISNRMQSIPAAAAILAASAFGGLSGVSQTNTVTKNAGLSIRHYILWKLLHAALSSMALILMLYL